MLGRFTFWLIDWIALTIGTIWATVQVASESSRLCAATESDAQTFRKVFFAQLIFAYLYLVRIWLFVCLSCLGVIVYFGRRQAEMQEQLDRIPMAANAINRLKRTNFKNLDDDHRKMADTCIICYCAFEEED